jgi:hypothetical protein
MGRSVADPRRGATVKVDVGAVLRVVAHDRGNSRRSSRASSADGRQSHGHGRSRCVACSLVCDGQGVDVAVQDRGFGRSTRASATGESDIGGDRVTGAPVGDLEAGDHVELGPIPAPMIVLSIGMKRLPPLPVGR